MPHHLRAPTQPGEILLSPPGSLAELVRRNEAAFAPQREGEAPAEPRGTSDSFLPQRLGGSLALPLTSLRRQARAEILVRATRYTTELIGPVSDVIHPQFWVIGGHQPELFHPGVWVKNAVVASLASQVGGVGLNLVVDNDICSGASIRVPLSSDSPGMMSLDWDHPQPSSPWEERLAPDPELFRTFGERCREQLRPWGIEPLTAGQDWGESPERGIVDRLVQLRGRFERSLGVRNLELKVSDLADTECFRRFVGESLRDAASLRDAYNAALAEFRALNHIRSQSHPVPSLGATANGIETPFWVWRAGEQRRSRLYVQSLSSDDLCLHDGQREIGTISAGADEQAVAELSALRQRGWKIRPRALTLTLFCRVALGSTFVHGIGGAKYDELTDSLIQRWLGLTPPVLIVATATQRLFERFAGFPLEPQIARWQHELRTIQWNPESVPLKSEPTACVSALRTEKEQLRTSPLPPAAKHARIQSINTALRSTLIEHEQQTRQTLQQLVASLPHQQSLRSREFPANLFPVEAIRELFRKATVLSLP